MTPADLAGWTPVALDFAGAAASIDWGDLRGVRFAEPFFQQTVERWAGADPAPLVRTGLDALEALDAAPSLDPCALVFHTSRCGSTLLSRLLGTVPGVLVVAEPAPLNALLLAEDVDVGTLRLLVRALGRRRFGDERHYVLKLSSWNVRRHAMLRRAFPAAAAIWLQRDPVAILSSLLASPPGWLGLRQSDRAPAIFGIAEMDEGVAAFLVRALAAMLAAASDIADEALLLDYAELPEAVWSRVAPFLGIDLTPADVTRMRQEARYDAKALACRPFGGDDPARPALAPDIGARLAASAAPLYRELERRRASRDFLAPPRL
jgi:hypothetical protein